MLIKLEFQISKENVVGYGFKSDYVLTKERYSVLFFVIKTVTGINTEISIA